MARYKGLATMGIAMSDESKLAAEYRQLCIKLEKVNRQLEETVTAHEQAGLPPYPGNASEKEVLGAHSMLLKEIDKATEWLEKLKSLLA